LTASHPSKMLTVRLTGKAVRGRGSCRGREAMTTPAERLGQLVSARADVLHALLEGRVDEALERGEAILPEARDLLEETPAQQGLIPHLVHFTGLLADLAAAELQRGQLDTAAKHITEILGLQDRLAAAADALTYIGTGYCRHGQPTLDPGDDCASQPPCPP
jgi:hypothetical protein